MGFLLRRLPHFLGRAVRRGLVRLGRAAAGTDSAPSRPSPRTARRSAASLERGEPICCAAKSGARSASLGEFRSTGSVVLRRLQVIISQANLKYRAQPMSFGFCIGIAVVVVRDPAASPASASSS